MSTYTEQPDFEHVRDAEWLFTAFKVGFVVMAAGNWVRDRLRQGPAFGQEQITSPIGADETVNPRALAVHLQRARYLLNGVVLSDANLARLRGRGMGGTLLYDSHHIAMHAPRRRSISFENTLAVAAERRYADALRSDDPLAREHVVNLGIGFARETFDAVNLELLGQDAPGHIGRE